MEKGGGLFLPKINEKRGSGTKEEGSITVFLCFLFSILVFNLFASSVKLDMQ